MRKLLIKLAQLYANNIISSLETVTNETLRDLLYAQAAALVAYCVVMHDIYLD
jgi:hypothetical protein